MSNLIINIRFWYYHLQVSKGCKSITFTRNKHIETLKGISKIQVFKLFN